MCGAGEVEGPRLGLFLEDPDAAADGVVVERDVELGEWLMAVGVEGARGEQVLAALLSEHGLLALRGAHGIGGEFWPHRQKTEDAGGEGDEPE